MGGSTYVHDWYMFRNAYPSWHTCCSIDLVDQYKYMYMYMYVSWFIYTCTYVHNIITCNHIVHVSLYMYDVQCHMSIEALTMHNCCTTTTPLQTKKKPEKMGQCIVIRTSIQCYVYTSIHVHVIPHTTTLEPGLVAIQPAGFSG